MYLAEIGSRIRRERKARGLTQAALAAEAGIARETLSQLEAGAARELGFGRIARLLRALGLEMRLLESTGQAPRDYVAIAAVAGSTGFREPLSSDELIRALLTGVAPARKGPHLRRLLEDASPAIVRGLLAQVSAWSDPAKVERNLIAIARKLGIEPRSEWTQPA